MATDLPPVGTLSRMPILTILKWVFETQFTGVLALIHEDIKKSLVFEGGRPVAARSNIRSENLGAMLLTERKVKPADIAKSLEIMQGDQASHQGQALISMGCLDAAMLNDFLRRQLILRIHEVFMWVDGRYGIVNTIPEGTTKIAISETLPEIVLRGLLLKYTGSKEAAALDGRAKPTVTGGEGVEFEMLKLVGRETAFVRAINGLTSIQDLFKGTRLEEPAARAMLLALRDLKVIRFADESVAASTPATPSPPSPTSAAPKRSGVSAEVSRRLEAAKKQTLYEVLGLTPKTTAAEVKAAYFDLARKFHPDRLPPGASAVERKDAEALFARIAEAHTKLSNDGVRKEYDASQTLEAQGVTKAKMNEILKSEEEFQRGMMLIRKGDFAAAAESLKAAVQLYDKEPEYVVFLGWATFRNGVKMKSQTEMRKGKEEIERAIKMKGDLAKGYHYLAMIYKTEGDLEMARKLFAKTVELDPRDTEANSELRVLNLRKEKEGGKRGLFGKKGS